MGNDNTQRGNWLVVLSRYLERWSPVLFFVASGILLIGAVHRGAVLLSDGLTYNDWIGVTKLFGRLLVLLGIAGLSVRITNRHSGLGTLSSVVVSVAALFALVLTGMAALAAAGFSVATLALVGLGTFVLSVSTYLLFGVAIIRTGAYSTRVGGLLLAAAVALLAVFVGQQFAPVDVVGVFVESTLFVLYLSIGHVLRTGRKPFPRPEPVPDTTS